MAVLRAIVASSALIASACYGPELRDCAVSCASPDDCAPGQVCGEDRWCAAPAIAGRCSSSDAGTSLSSDAAVEPDAPSADAGPPDAPVPVILVIQIMGHGLVTIANVGTCDDHAPGHQCTFAVYGGVSRQLVATGTEGNEFEKWASVACAGQDETCSLTPVLPSTTVAAKFH
ncbi:hypothetical protein BH11MYX3_BH11MYX3_46270 [soil metagenome]